MGTKSGKNQAPLSSLSDLCRAGGEEDSAENWDQETDVLVIGYGAAGASAAIAAHDAGARVLIVEKMEEPGGNTRSAGGGFIIPEDAGKAYEYLSMTFAFADDEMDEDLVRTFCQGASRLRGWFERIAPEARLEILGHANFPNLPLSVRALCLLPFAEHLTILGLVFAVFSFLTTSQTKLIKIRNGVCFPTSIQIRISFPVQIVILVA